MPSSPGPDLTGAITTVAITTDAAARAASRAAAATRSLDALSGDLRALRRDVEAGRAVPRDLLLSLNRETRAADAARGTVHL